MHASCRSGNKGEGGIFAAHFETPDVLLLARGSPAKPTFERIAIPVDRSKQSEVQLKHLTVSVHLHLPL
jgi:hypothetical protein